jgi:hypothetical protein
LFIPYFFQINGIAVSGLLFEEIVLRLRNLPRPVVIHFVQVNPNLAGKKHESIDDSSHSADSSSSSQHGVCAPSIASPSFADIQISTETSQQEPAILVDTSCAIQGIDEPVKHDGDNH